MTALLPSALVIAPPGFIFTAAAVGRGRPRQERLALDESLSSWLAAPAEFKFRRVEGIAFHPNKGAAR